MVWQFAIRNAQVVRTSVHNIYQESYLFKKKCMIKCFPLKIYILRINIFGGGWCYPGGRRGLMGASPMLGVPSLGFSLRWNGGMGGNGLGGLLVVWILGTKKRWPIMKDAATRWWLHYARRSFLAPNLMDLTCFNKARASEPHYQPCYQWREIVWLQRQQKEAPWPNHDQLSTNHVKWLT